jgi:hypothetical protein
MRPAADREDGWGNTGTFWRGNQRDLKNANPFRGFVGIKLLHQIFKF